MFDPAKQDKKNIWHPFTQMQEWGKEDFPVIAKGKGNYLHDTNGKKYFDGVSSLWVTVHGHQKRELDSAIKKQLGLVAHTTFLGLSHEPGIMLAKKLLDIVPKNLTRVFYSDNGSTAVEIALKMAFQYWQQKRLKGKGNLPALLRKAMQAGKSKVRFLTLVNAYHGDTIGSVSLGGIDLFHKTYKPLLFKSFKAPSPYCYRCRDNDLPATLSSMRQAGKCQMTNDKLNPKSKCIKKLEAIFKKHHHEIAAMIVEPMVQAAAGMLTMPKGYLKKVRELCTKYDVLLIADEVATGFGRTGKMFASEHEDIKPDIMCLAKGITGGYLPLAATLTTEKIYKAFLGKHEDKKTFYHGHTYTANPLGCAAALANLKIFRKENTLQKLQPKIALLKRELEKFKTLPHVGDIRQVGMMVGIELVADKKTKKEFSMELRVGHRVILEARKMGVILRPLGDVIVLMPPLSSSKEELLKLANITEKAIKLAMKDIRS